MESKIKHQAGRRGRLVASVACLAIAASSALAADCWNARDFLCCKSMSMACEFKEGQQSVRWFCPQTSDRPAGFKIKVVSVAGKGVKGKKDIGSPSVVGECKITRTKCGQMPGECLVTAIETVVCTQVQPEGGSCVGGE